MHIVYLPILAQAALAALYTSPEQLTKSAYDFVVVGSGTAGNVVANRISANPLVSVLVIEAGGEDTGLSELQVPFTSTELLSDPSLFWGYNTVPQAFASNRTLPYPHGKVVGGSSSINFLEYTRGSRDDWDRYANVTGDFGWSWDAMLPFMMKAENFTPPRDNHNTTGQFNPQVHGNSGPLLTTLPAVSSEIDRRMIASTQVDPENFPFNTDGNSGNTIGISWTQMTAGLGQRSSSATGYLHPASSRANLDVLINTQVTRLLKSQSAIRNLTSNRQTEFRTVEFAHNSTSSRSTIVANKEVVLSAGAINTPQILLLSGIGDKEQLSQVGIQTIVNSPGVGQNLRDHIQIESTYLVNSNSTLDNITRNQTLANQLLLQWTQNRTGQFASLANNQMVWLRITNSTVFEGSQDPSAGPTSSHIELVVVDEFASFLEPLPASGHFLTVANAITSPVSSGTVKLNTSSPFDFPIIDPGFLSNPLDTKMMIEALHASANLLALSPWDDYVIEPHGAPANTTSDEELAALIPRSIFPLWHTCGTAKMGTFDDVMAVVDPALLLKDVTGVRVVDASVLPYLPAAHSQALTYAVAERASHLIQTAWGI